MLRWSVGSFVVVALLAGSLLAADDKKDNKDNSANKANPATAAEHKDHQANQGEKAKVVNVNPKEGTITLEMKGKDGQEHKRTFHLTEDVRVFDENTGRAAALDVFQSGDEVLFVEAQGKLRELHKNKGHHNAGEENHSGKKDNSKDQKRK